VLCVGFKSTGLYKIHPVRAGIASSEQPFVNTNLNLVFGIAKLICIVERVEPPIILGIGVRAAPHSPIRSAAIFRRRVASTPSSKGLNNFLTYLNKFVNNSERNFK